MCHGNNEVSLENASLASPPAFATPTPPARAYLLRTSPCCKGTLLGCHAFISLALLSPQLSTPPVSLGRRFLMLTQPLQYKKNWGPGMGTSADSEQWLQEGSERRIRRGSMSRGEDSTNFPRKGRLWPRHSPEPWLKHNCIVPASYHLRLKETVAHSTGSINMTPQGSLGIYTQPSIPGASLQCFRPLSSE